MNTRFSNPSEKHAVLVASSSLLDKYVDFTSRQNCFIFKHYDFQLQIRHRLYQTVFFVIDLYIKFGGLISQETVGVLIGF